MTLSLPSLPVPSSYITHPLRDAPFHAGRNRSENIWALRNWPRQRVDLQLEPRAIYLHLPPLLPIFNPTDRINCSLETRFFHFACVIWRNDIGFIVSFALALSFYLQLSFSTTEKLLRRTLILLYEGIEKLILNFDKVNFPSLTSMIRYEYILSKKKEKIL